MRKLVLVLIVVTLGMGSFGCGSGSSDDPLLAPTISSITDGNEATVALTESTGIFPTSFVVTFDIAMDDATLIADNITLTCGDLAAATLTFDIDSTNTILTITPANSSLYQMSECTLAFSNSITNAAGTPLTAIEYVFTNACALDDDFSNPAATQACWSVADDSEFTTWDELLATTGIFSFASLDYNGLNATEESAINKSVAVSSTNFTLNMHISSIEIASGKSADFVGIGLTANSKSTTPATGEAIVIGFGADMMGGDPACMVLYSPDGELATYVGATASCTGNEYYLRLTVEGTTITAEYSTDGTTYTPMTDAMGIWPPADFSTTGLNYMGLQFGHYSETGSTATVHYATSTGVTSTTMY